MILNAEKRSWHLQYYTSNTPFSKHAKLTSNPQNKMNALPKNQKNNQTIKIGPSSNQAIFVFFPCQSKSKSQTKMKPKPCPNKNPPNPTNRGSYATSAARSSRELIETLELIAEAVESLCLGGGSFLGSVEQNLGPLKGYFTWSCLRRPFLFLALLKGSRKVFLGVFSNFSRLLVYEGAKDLKPH